MMYLLEGPVKGHITEARSRKESQHLAGIEPQPLLRCMRSTAVLSPLPNKVLVQIWVPSFGGDRSCSRVVFVTLKQ